MDLANLDLTQVFTFTGTVIASVLGGAFYMIYRLLSENLHLIRQDIARHEKEFEKRDKQFSDIIIKYDKELSETRKLELKIYKHDKKVNRINIRPYRNSKITP